MVYREYFSEKGIFENKEIPGIREMLEVLSAQGKKLYVATSKPEVYARKILEHFSLDHFFNFIGGADFEETRVNKAAVIRYVLEEAGLGGAGKKTADVIEGAEGAKKTEEAKRTDNAERTDKAERTDNAERTEPGKKRIVMIGDREHDIIGAKENGIQSVGVLFGYGSRRELKEAGADRIAETVKDLTDILRMDWGD